MKKGVLPVAAGLCAVAVIAMIIALLCSGRQEEFSPPPFDAAAQTGEPEVPESAGYGELDAKEFRFSAAGRAYSTGWENRCLADQSCGQCRLAKGADSG